jgi:hypothetical protein
MDFDDYDFDIFSVSDEGGVGSDILEESDITRAPDVAQYISRSHNYWQQIPLPAEFGLCGTNVLASLDDETLLTMSPSLIAHIQRSEASGGLQVVSPRTVTLGGIAARTNHDKRTTDMFIVGSGASKNLDWPVVSDPVPASLLSGEPIDSYPSDPAARAKTVSTGIVPSSGAISDPVTKAFVTGRALVDLQRRPDVGGSADALSKVIAACWGLDYDEYEEMAEASLSPVGPLLRYAIRADDVQPTINAPVHAKKCISVGANTSGRQLYGEASAIDWRRLRVLAESIFYQSSRLEGYTLAQMALTLPPGNPRAPPNRPGVLQMRPLPGSVWTFDSDTFRLDITADPHDITGVPVPDRVRKAVIDYHETVNPIAHAADSGANVSFSASLSHTVKDTTGEAIVAGYKAVLAQHSTVQARGRTAPAAVRGFIYECLANATTLTSIRAIWLARYMHETTEAMNLTFLLDATTTKHVAQRMLDVTSDLRTRLAVEAGRRGATLEEWWADMAAQLPWNIRSMSEGSGTWALAFSHMLLHPPTPKWTALVRALAHSSHSTLARRHLSDVRLPALTRSAERSFQAGAAAARQLGTSYGAFYEAMYDVACVLSARQRRAGATTTADRIMLAGLMWDIRAKVASTVKLHAEDGTSEQAGSFSTKHGRYHLTTAPYAAYQRWHQALNKSSLVKREMKALFPHHCPAVVSRAFASVDDSLFVTGAGAKCRLNRYADQPSRLARDIEKTLLEITADVSAVMDYYDNEGFDAEPAEVTLARSDMELRPISLDLSGFKPPQNSYWDLVATMDQLDAQDIVDTVLKLDDALATEIEDRQYDSIDDLKKVVWGFVEEAQRASAKGRDAVV